MTTYQHPVLDRGGRRTRAGTVRLGALTLALRPELVEDETSLGAMIGNRSGCFPDASPRLFGITRLVTVMRPDLTTSGLSTSEGRKDGLVTISGEPREEALYQDLTPPSSHTPAVQSCPSSSEPPGVSAREVTRG